MRIINITVNLTEASRGLIHTVVELPVYPSSVAKFTTPLWIQESHRDNGPVASIAGLYFSANGKTLHWRRNPVAASEYHVDIPRGIDMVHAEFDSIITQKVTRRIVMLGWEHVLLHPANRDIGKTPIQAAVTVPEEWDVGTALENLGRPVVTSSSGRKEKTLLYQPTSVERLADSPVLTGLHYRKFAVTADKRHILCVAADTAEYAEVPLEIMDKLARLVQQTHKVFGVRHYEAFWFLVALTDYWPRPGGSEHHDSFDVNLPRKALSKSPYLEKNGYVIAHEFIHSWNGKYRRPAGHSPTNFATPLDGRLLWIYEGLTEYYAGVLSVRSGIMSADTFRVKLAETIAWLRGQRGRMWRSTEDTGTGASLRPATAWNNWTRNGQDYYFEGMLVWLDVDTMIRSLTDGQRSLDNFARRFFGGEVATGPEVISYSLDAVVWALKEVADNDWRAFFENKVLSVSSEVNLAGVERAGYDFTYSLSLRADSPESVIRTAIWDSIGIKIGENACLEDVKRFGLADAAKLAPGQIIVEVNRCVYSLRKLAKEIWSSNQLDNMSPIELKMSQEGEIWDVQLDYHDGLRFPQVERRAETPDILSTILDGDHINS